MGDSPSILGPIEPETLTPPVVPAMTDFQRRQMLDLLMHIAGPETRRRVMRELPEAYNAYYGRRIALVVVDNGR